MWQVLPSLWTNGPVNKPVISSQTTSAGGGLVGEQLSLLKRTDHLISVSLPRTTL